MAERREKQRGKYSIAAYAIVNALGHTTADVMRAAFAGEARFTSPPSELGVPFPTRLAAMSELPPPPSTFEEYDTRLARMVALATREVEDAVRGACDRFSPARVGLLFATCTGGLESTEVAWPRLRAGEQAPRYSFERHHPVDAVRTRLALHLGIGGPSYTISTACSSSAKAFATAHGWLRADIVDAVVVCGADTLCRTTVFGFHALGALSRNGTQPFTASRDGITLGEGAGLVLLQRGDGPLGVALLGVGESSDAYHLSSPDPEGRGALRAMQGAVASAEQGSGVPFDLARVSHVSAHGTGTPHNDIAEGTAIATLLGPGKLVTATKSLTGHLLGAAGVTAVALAAESLRTRRVPPTPVPEASLDASIPVRACVKEERIAASADCALVNAFAFGGNNTSVLLSA